MPIFGNKNKNGELACNFMHTDGVPNFPKGAGVCITQEDGNARLSISLRLGKHLAVYLMYNQIISTGVVSETEIIEKGKSVVGRAAVGGLLLGPLGAIVGGISGAGNKSKATSKRYFVINYKSSDSEEVKVLSFEIVGASLHWDKFLSELKTKLPKQETSNFL